MFPMVCFRRSAALLAASALFTVQGCKDSAPPNASKPAPSQTVPAVKTAIPTSFDEVTAQLDPGGNFYFYLSTEQWLAGLSQQIASLREIVLSAAPGGDPAARAKTERLLDAAISFVQRSGLEQVRGFGASTITSELHLKRRKMFLHHPAGQGTGYLWSMVGKAAHRLDGLDLLPRKTAAAGFNDIDLAEVLATIRAEVAALEMPEVQQGLDMGLLQFSAMAGMPLEELLQSLGDSFGIIGTLDPEKQVTFPEQWSKAPAPKPAGAILLRVKDDRLFKLADRMLGANPAVVRVDEPALQMRSMPMPVTPDFEARPTIAQWDGWLIVASDEALVREIIAAKKEGNGYKSLPEFTKIAAGLPREGNSFQITTAAFGDALSQFQRDGLKAQQMTFPGQAQLMEKLMGFQRVNASYSVATRRVDGVLVVSQEILPENSTASALPIAPLAFAAGVAGPFLAGVEKRGAETRSLSQVRQIVLACKLYAADHGGAFPPTLAELVPDYLPDAKSLVSPLATEDPEGYNYTSGLNEKAAPETILLEDKHATAQGFRIVGRVDASAEIFK